MTSEYNKCISKAKFEATKVMPFAETNLGLECYKCNGKDTNHCFRPMNEHNNYSIPKKEEAIK